MVLVSRATAVRFLRPRLVPQQARDASTHAHVEEHDTHDYPKETIGSTTWRNTLLWSLAAVAFYKYAPAPGDDSQISRWLSQLSYPRDWWMERNSKHSAQVKENADATLLFNDAKKERIHRYRYPQMLEMASPHLEKVGNKVDMTGVVLKSG